MKNTEFRPGDIVIGRVGKEIFVVIDVITNDQHTTFIELQSMFDGKKYKSAQVLNTTWFNLIHREQNENS